MDDYKTKYIVINESVIGSIIKDIVTFSMFAGISVGAIIMPQGESTLRT